MNIEIGKILAKPDVLKQLNEQAIYVMPMSPDQFEKYIVDEVKHWSEVARISKVEAE